MFVFVEEYILEALCYKALRDYCRQKIISVRFWH